MNNNDEHIDFEDNEKLSPLLSRLKDRNSFNVPSSYFDELPSRIQTTINDKNISFSFLDKIQKLVHSLKFKVAISSLAVITIIGVAYFTVIKNGGTKTVVNQELLFGSISNQELIAYASDHQLFDENMMIEAYIDEKIETGSNDVEITNLLEQKEASIIQNNEIEQPSENSLLTDEEYNDLLFDNHIDINDLDIDEF